MTAVVEQPLSPRRLQLDDKGIPFGQSVADMLTAGSKNLLRFLKRLRMRGERYTMRDFFPIAPLFDTLVPAKQVLKCGRKVAKTSTIVTKSIIRALCTPSYKKLFVLPRESQANRVSEDHLLPTLRTSDFYPGCMGAHHRREGVRKVVLGNDSSFEFSYAYLDADRLRSIVSDDITIDEAQDMAWEFIPIIFECSSASPYAFEEFSGTAKNYGDTLNTLFNDSTKGEWVIPCSSCGRRNLCALEGELLKMTQNAGLSCAYCNALVDTRKGYWQHVAPKQPGFRGFHIPQQILPIHCERPAKWRKLIEKRDGMNGYTHAKYLNEVCGEECDVGSSLLTEQQIKDACQEGWINDFDAAKERLQRYPMTALGIDWSGNGEDGESTTSVSACGVQPNTPYIDCHYVTVMRHGLTSEEQVTKILEMWYAFNIKILAHDYGNVGADRETMCINTGVPRDRVFNVLYGHFPTRPMIFYDPPSASQVRDYRSADKSRTLSFQASCIKNKPSPYIRLPNWESAKQHLGQMTNLLEEMRQPDAGPARVFIMKKPKSSDDLAHGLNFACLALWTAYQRFPPIGQHLIRPMFGK